MGDYSLKITGRTKAWYSPAKNIYSIIRQNGAGKYTISMKVLTTAVTPEAPIIGTLIRTQTENSFSTDHSGNYFYRLAGKYSGVTANNWFTLSGTVDILDSDISAETGLFRLMFDHLDPVDGQAVYIDDIRIEKYSEPDDFEIDKTSGYLYIGETMKINTNKEYGIGFYSSNKNVATVNNKGEVTAVSAGQTTIHVTHGSQKRYCTVTVDPKCHVIKDGMYFLRNGQYGSYMQVDEVDSANNYGTERVNMELRTFGGRSQQKWNISYLGEGYYKIANSASGKVLSVQSGSENTDSSILVQETYNASSRQKWQMQLLDDGYFKIKPKSSESYSTDWCIAADTYTGTSNERKVRQFAYSANDNFSDEWRLQEYSSSADFSGVSIEYDSVNRSYMMGNVMEYLRTMGINKYYYVAADTCSKATALRMLDNSKIFVSRSHGGYDDNSTHISLSHEPYICLYSTDLQNYDLSNLDIAIFAACRTAVNRDTGKNLIDVSVERGAKCGIGFSEEIYTYQANIWTEYFFLYYSSGKSIVESCSLATERAGASTRYYQIAIKEGAA